MICSIRSKASLASLTNLYAPWLVPIATARLSIPVRSAKSLASSGIGEILLDVLFVFGGIESHDVFLDPAEHPEFGLDDDAQPVWAALTASAEIVTTFSSYGWCDPSIMTEVYPSLMQVLISSTVSPWSQWMAIGTAGYSSTQASMILRRNRILA